MMYLKPFFNHFRIEDYELLLRIAVQEMSQLFVKIKDLHIRVGRLVDDVVSDKGV